MYMLYAVFGLASFWVPHCVSVRVHSIDITLSLRERMRVLLYICIYMCVCVFVGS
jgi:hypothetical protein